MTKLSPDTVFVYWSFLRTDAPYGSTSWYLAKELARSHRVFYVNHPQSLKDVLLRASSFQYRPSFTARNRYFRDEKSGIHIVEPPVTLPINRLSPGRLYDFLARFNGLLIRKCLNQLLKDHRLDQWIYLNCYDPTFWLREKTGVCPLPLARIYQSVDNIGQERYTARHGVLAEKEAETDADLVLTTSSELTAGKAWVSPERLFFLPNGADVERFSEALTEKKEPSAHPRVGYVGNLDKNRVDFALLARLVDLLPGMDFLFVGPYDPKKVQDSGLGEKGNVQFLGTVSFEEVISHLRGMDIGLIPFLCNALTRSIYPLKINEYLAAGKPVVSTPFSEDVRSFAPHIDLASTADEFAGAIQRRLAEKDPARVRERRQLAAQNSWEKRARQLLSILEEYLTQ